MILENTYSQNWAAYNKAQTNEGHIFMRLLSELCGTVSQEDYKFGRPKLLLADMIFASALKVYSTFSLRRFSSMMKIATEREYMDKPCSYTTISNYMRKASLTPVLHELIEMSSLPLTSIEEDFAVDSSGFSTSRFARYYSFKHRRDLKYKMWIKAHLISGVKTNVVTGVEVTDENKNDCPFFKPLVEKTAKNFNINEVSGDKAYSSKDNHRLVDSLGGKAYIPFKKNAADRRGGCLAWNKMHLLFMCRQDEFMKHYHKRSNAETVFSMMKAKFGDSIRSKDKTAQVNEVLLKVLCHNICVVIQEIYELNFSHSS